MAQEESFHGYPPEYGQDFLLDKILKYDFAAYGVPLPRMKSSSATARRATLETSEISSGGEYRRGVRPDLSGLCGYECNGGARPEIYWQNGRWSNFVYLPCTAEHHFLPELPTEHADLIYLCFPNNPTGMAIDFDGLKQWVDYANREGSVILYDAAYEAYITQEGIPHSIYQIEGAKNCAIEFRSYSKTAGFTGVRCAYTVVPKELKRNGVSLNNLWARRQATKFNGVSYVTQRAAQAVYSDAGRREVRKIIGYYQRNARVIAEGLRGAGFQAWGGVNSPISGSKHRMTSPPGHF